MSRWGGAMAFEAAAWLTLATACGRVGPTGAPVDASTSVDSPVADSGAMTFDVATSDQATESSPPVSDASPDAPRDSADGACPSAATFYDKGCGNPQTDPHNCGGCGHDCGGGACEAGTCIAMPTGALATGQLAPIALAADGTNVYWLNHGADVGGGGMQLPIIAGAQVMACAASGCGNSPTVLASLSIPSGSGMSAGGIPVAPSAIATDGTNVYWTTSQSVQACAVGGCGCAPTLVASPLSQPPGVTVAAGRIFFSVWASGSPYSGEVGRCAAVTCPGGPTVVASGQGGALGLAADSTDVCWLDTYGQAGAGSVLRCAVTGCVGGPEQMWAGTVSGVSQPGGITVDATHIYWTNAGLSAGSVMQCDKAACGATLVTLASNRADASGIAVDATDVYWSEGNTLQVRHRRLRQPADARRDGRVGEIPMGRGHRGRCDARVLHAQVGRLISANKQHGDEGGICA